MKRLLCLALALVCGVTAFLATGGDWRRLAGPVVRLVVDDVTDDYRTGGEGVPVAIDDRYEMRFPAVPERTADRVDLEDGRSTELVSYFVGGDTLEYLVQYFDAPEFGMLDEAGREALMKQVALSDQGFFKGTLLNWTPIPERSSLEFTVRYDDGGFIKATARIEGERIYFFAVGDDRNPPRTFERFTYSATPRQGSTG